MGKRGTARNEMGSGQATDGGGGGDGSNGKKCPFKKNGGGWQTLGVGQEKGPKVRRGGKGGEGTLKKKMKENKIKPKICDGFS